MTVLSAIQQAATVVGIEMPQVLFTTNDRTSVEVQAATNAAARQILDEHDWQALIKIATITGDGATVEFPLPSDYYRMTLAAELRTQTGWPGWTIESVSSEDWLALDSLTFPAYRAYWSIFGNKLHLQPTRPSGETIRYTYIQKNIATAQDGSAKSEFTADTDVFVLSERLLTLCFIATWRRNKGEDYAADQNEYELALSNLAAKDGGTRLIRNASRSRFPNARLAWPWSLG